MCAFFSFLLTLPPPIPPTSTKKEASSSFSEDILVPTAEDPTLRISEKAEAEAVWV